MAFSKVSSKGQITLPAESRRAVGIQPHDRVIIRVSGNRIVVEPARDLFELKGFLGKALPAGQERRGMMRGAAGHPGKGK